MKDYEVKKEALKLQEELHEVCKSEGYEKSFEGFKNGLKDALKQSSELSEEELENIAGGRIGEFNPLKKTIAILTAGLTLFQTSGGIASASGLQPAARNEFEQKKGIKDTVKTNLDQLLSTLKSELQCMFEGNEIQYSNKNIYEIYPSCHYIIGNYIGKCYKKFGIVEDGKILCGFLESEWCFDECYRIIKNLDQYNNDYFYYGIDLSDVFEELNKKYFSKQNINDYKTIKDNALNKGKN